MFEPTNGCPHLQPLELMEKAEEVFLAEGGELSRKSTSVEITEITPGHMFKAIVTTLNHDGKAWMVSKVDRHLSADGLTPGHRFL